MSTTISMWLGIAFLMLAIIAVLLQAWLWGPKFWDEEAKLTRAPKFWLRMHALAGYSYGVIYLVMMYFMLPRLWEYQYELPARTVIHAVLAIAIGVLLITKIMILLFFRHFEEAMPRYGFGLLICTVAMIILSVPYALRAHDLEGRTTDPENIQRVRTLMAEIELPEGIDRDFLVTEAGFERGRDVLVHKCITCHDMRTILAKPRTAKGWYGINERMLEKPAVFGDALDEADIPYVTAYLVAITPDIQKSAKQKREDSREVLARTNRMVDAAHAADTSPGVKVDEKAGDALLQGKCIDCHELDEVEEHGGDDVAGWRSVIAAMVEEGTELTQEESELLAHYLAVRYPAKAGAETPLPPETEPEELEPAGDDGDMVVEDDGEPEDGDGGDEATPPEVTPAEPAPAEPELAPKPKPKKKKPAPPKADRAAGRELYMAKCKTCHGDDGKGDTPFGRKLEIVSLAGTGRSRAKIKAITANGVPGTKMKPYEGKLSDQELENVAAFVKGL
ncbi:MAG: c-type cytochrome [Myxococcales bacterium]|nr:c-type cytochrome [Myxococcales bacterium]